MAVLLFPSKTPADVITLSFPFAGQMNFGEAALGMSVNVGVFSGTDPSPGSIILGAPTFSSDNTKVLQQVQLGVPGVIYSIIGAMNTDAGNVYTVTGRLAVEDSLEQFV